MVGGPSYALVRDIQTLFDAGTVGGLTDRQLLDRFLQGRDASSDAAFEVLVRRHGPMVLRVCRNVLGDLNDAEDAFQATFVVLARRCGSIRKRDSVESWLFGVACRVAARARVEAARRKAVERRGATEADAALGASPDDEADNRELGPLVQEEVRRLPERYRGPVVLCYWEGLTQEQAAAQLGCPLGTVRSRLARAREILRRRLTRRGAAPLAGLGVAGLDLASAGPVPAAVPDAWVAATVKAATVITAGAAPVTAGAVSASVAVLVKDVMRSLLMMKVKTSALGLAFVGLGAFGVILAAPQDGKDAAAGRSRQAATKDGASSTPAKEATQARGRSPAIVLKDYVIEPPDLILVEVLEALPGRPISGERLVRPDGRISLGFYGEVYVAGLTLGEAKEKVVLKLREYLADRLLGLTEGDDANNLEGPVPTAKLRLTDRVFVDVVQMNSKVYYVQGAVREPGRLPYTGRETVLDALNLAGGLGPNADYADVKLYRPGPPGTKGPLQALPVNIDQIVMGSAPTTNYQLMPGDRLVVPFKKKDGGVRSHELPSDSGAVRDDSDGLPAPRPSPATSRVRTVPENPRRRDNRSTPDGPALREIERRLDALERKIDRVLDALEERGR
jgi:polysaccharide biosynthesis/export protein